MARRMTTIVSIGLSYSAKIPSSHASIMEFAPRTYGPWYGPGRAVTRHDAVEVRPYPVDEHDARRPGMSEDEDSAHDPMRADQDIARIAARVKRLDGDGGPVVMVCTVAA